MRGKKHLFLCTIFGVVCAAFLAACGGGEEAIPMGRYADREVKLPGNKFDYMHPCPDGGYYLLGYDADLTYVAPDGTVSREPWGWENTANIHIKFSYGVSDGGAVIFGYTPLFYSDEEYEAYAAEGDNRYLYYYVGEDGDRYPLELYGADYQKASNLEKFAFAPDGRVYAASADRVYRIDVESGEAESLFATAGQVREFAFIGDTLLALDPEKAYLYDMAQERLLEDNSVLSDFAASHQSGGIVTAVSDQEIDVPILSDREETESGGSGEQPGQDAGMEETDGAAGEGAKILYLACRTGLYRYVWGGSVIEQVADGRMTALGDSQYRPCALQALDNGEFRVFFSSNYMVEMYYDETLPARPSRELSVYSLEENGRVRYAGRLFQKEHPDVLVKYETGMEGDNAVGREDALKNLSTRILAGETPDVIVLDGIDLEQYAAKGVLRELDGLLAPYLEEDVLYRNIVEGMRMTEEEKIYGVPITVDLPVCLAEKKYLENVQGLEDLVAGAELARAQHPEGPLIDTPFRESLFDIMIPICLPAWTGEDGRLDEESLAEFYRVAARLWELDCAGLDEAERLAWQQALEEGGQDLTNIMFGQYNDYYHIGETWLSLGYLKNPWFGMTNLHTRMENFRLGYSEKELEDEVVYGRLVGQAGNVCQVRTVTGLCGEAKEPELAEEFLELLLSDTMMQKWWLEGQFDGGLPIRKDSLEALLDRNNHAFAEAKGWDAGDISAMYKENFWPSEEELRWLFGAMEESDRCYRADTALESVVREVGLRVLAGELSPEKGAEEVAKKMAISLEE